MKSWEAKYQNQKRDLGGRSNFWVIHSVLMNKDVTTNLRTHHAPCVKLIEIFKAAANEEQESMYSHLGEGGNKLSLKLVCQAVLRCRKGNTVPFLPAQRIKLYTPPHVVYLRHFQAQIL